MPENIDKLNLLISRFPEGRVFGYGDLAECGMSMSELSVKLNRLTEQGVIVRILRGRYQVKQQSQHEISAADVIRAVCHYRNRVSGYETGQSIWKKWGLIEDCENDSTFYIGTMQMRPAQYHHGFIIRFRKARLDPAQYNQELLLFLDALEATENIIFQSSAGQFFEKMIMRYRAWPTSLQQQLPAYALAYRPATRALCGALLDELGKSAEALRLSASLHPASKYRIPGAAGWCKTASKWNIFGVTDKSSMRNNINN